MTGAALSLLPLPTVRALAHSGWTQRPVDTDGPVGRIDAGGPTGLLGIGRDGSLAMLSPTGERPRRVIDGLDATTPLASGHDRIAGRTIDGLLWVMSRGTAQVVATARLAPHAGLLQLPLAILAVVDDGVRQRIARFESLDGRWRETDRSTEIVLPDARPMQVALDGTDPDGHVLVLAGPDADRYDHGILGDRIEATRMVWLERHGLDALRAMTLDAPVVFEDIAPRVVRTARGTALMTMLSDGVGTRLALVASDRSDPKGLRLVARGEPVGGRHRWLAPTTDGRRLLAVHTPHLEGMLHVYRVEGERLVARIIARGVANHRIGTRDLDLSVWMGDELVIPRQDGRALRVFDASDDCAEREPIPLPSRVASTAPWSRTGFGVLMDDGGVLAVTRR